MYFLFVLLLIISNNFCTTDFSTTTTIKRTLGYLLYTPESSTPLAANQEYNSGPIDISEYSLIGVTLKGSPNNASGTLYIEMSPDAIHWDRVIQIKVSNLAEEPPHTALPVSCYCRIRYVNGETNQTEFRLQGVFHRNSAKNLTARLEQEINSSTDVENVRAVIVGKNEAGSYKNVLVNTEQALYVNVKGATSAFGELTNSEPTAISQIQFTYGIHPELLTSYSCNQGTISNENNMIKLSTGISPYSFCKVLSKIPIKYNPGQGAFCRFSGIFSEGRIGSTQLIGVGDDFNGFFFGYKDDVFGILRREAGLPEVRILTLTRAASSKQTIDIILDGSTKSISVTNSNDITKTANEIAAADYSNTGSGWTARARGNQITFLSWNASNRNGTYNLVATSNPSNTRPRGTFERIITGKNAIDHFVPQSSWNGDSLNGTGRSGLTIDPTKGNVYQIRWQWLGFGAISYFIENPSTGSLEKIHVERFPNSSFTTSVANPNLPLHLSVNNETNATDITVRSGSIAGFIDGKETCFGISGAIRNTKEVAEDEVPLLTIRNRDIYNNILNKNLARINVISLCSTHSKPVEFSLYKNPTLIGAHYFATTDNSTIEEDTSATALSNGIYLGSFFLPPDGAKTVLLTSDPIATTLPPGNHFTLTAKALGTKSSENVYASIDFIELK